jgi:ribose transport system permease protein
MMKAIEATVTGADPASARPARLVIDKTRPRLTSEDKMAVALLALTIMLILSSGWISPALGSWSQVRATLVLSTFVMLVGFGQQTVMLTGGLDLSVPAIVTLGAVALFSWVGPEPAALVWGIPAVLALCAAIGAVNGLFVALLRVPPFIMTLAMGMIVASALLGITGGSPRGEAAPAVLALFAGNWLGVPPIVYLMAVFTVLAVVWQRRTAFGRMVYAVGTSPDAARIAGLPVARVTMLCYAVSGAAAGAAGVLYVGFAGGATLDTGQDILIPSIAAVVVGGTSIIGGRGSYLGVVGGALLLTTFSIMITALGVGAGWRAVINGSVILIALLTLQEDIRLWVGRALRTFGSTRRSGAIDSATTVKGKTS